MLLESPKLFNHQDKEYIEDILTALNSVNSIYYTWYNHKIDNTDYPSEAYQKAYCERVFAYELYHQIRKIMDANPALARYKDVYLNGETIKDNKFFKDIYDGLEELNPKFNAKNSKSIPDLVLHKDLGSTEAEGQIYLAEIKMKDNKNALIDLEKLTLFEKSKLNFTFYIFIYAGKNVEEFKEDLSKIETSTLSENIVCICAKYGESQCMTLGEILSEI